MKIYYWGLIISVFISCKNLRDKNSSRDTGQNDIISSDSVSAILRAVKSFREDVLSNQDSLKKYDLLQINDSCIKYIYTVYATKHLMRPDSLMVAECGIKLTGFSKNGNSIFNLRYSLFTRDSIPLIAEIVDDAMVHTITYNKIQKTITRAYLGQHNSYISGHDFMSLYHSNLSGIINQKYIKSSKEMHPDFYRLVLPDLIK